MLPHDHPPPTGGLLPSDAWPWSPDREPIIRGLAHWEWIIPDALVFFSREWQHMLQSDNEGVLGPTNAVWWPMVHEDDLDPFMEAARVVAEGHSDQYEALLRLRRGDGAWVWMLSRGCVIEKNGGRAVRVAGAIHDVTPLRTDVKFRHGQPGTVGGAPGGIPPLPAPDLVVHLTRTLEPLDSTPNLARALTPSPREADVPVDGPSDDASSGLPSAHRAFLLENVERVFDTGQPARTTVTFPTAYGHDVTGEYAFAPEYGTDGRLVAVVTQFRDLTEQLHRERRARLNEMRLEALHQLTQMDDAPREAVLDFVMDRLIHLTGSASGMLYFPGDPDGDEPGRVVWSPDRRERIPPGAPAHAAPPPELLALIDRDPRAKRRRLVNGNGLFPLLTVLDGGLAVMRYISAPVFDRGRLVCLAMVANKESLYYEDDLQQLEAFIRNAWLILRRHSFVRQLREAKDAAEAANRIKDSFLANVSHELRTPLNGLLGMVQLLETTPLTPVQQEYADTVGVCGRALLGIVSDLLDFSRMEAGKVELRPENMDLAETVRSSTRLLRQEAARKGLAFSVDIDPALPARVFGDEGRVRQIIFNVVGNALKFTDHGSVAVSCVRLPAGGPGDVAVRLRVRDTGIGIPPEKREAIFDPFVQLASSTRERNAGTGLGLTIIKRLVDLMGGRITIEGAAGAGTTLCCDLHFGEAVADASSSTTDAASPTKVRAPSMDILVVEDDAVSRFALMAFLRMAGHRPMGVDDGGQALEAMQLHRFHAVFTDIRMPRMDGLELVRRIREQDYADYPPTDALRTALRAAFPGAEGTARRIDPATVAVSVSAQAMAGDRERFLDQGVAYCISKPVLVKELRAVLTQVAERVFTS